VAATPERLFGDFDLSPYLADAHQDLTAEFTRHRVTAAVLGDEAFHRFLEAELPKTRTAFVEMLTDGLAVVIGNLAVEVPVDAVKYLAAAHFVRVSAAHALSSSA
jgi:hypothetical protein